MYITKIKRILFIITLILIAGCAYYNTFFNAKARYKEGQEAQKQVKDGKLPSNAQKSYTDAISKCWKLIDTYGDSSSYADDALLLIGKSHYHLQEYDKSERVLQQFISNYKSSEFIPEAKLWLARTYIELNKDDEAINELNNISQYKISNEIASESFYILGDLKYKRGQYNEAVDNFLKSIELTSDEEKAGRGNYYIGESFFQLKDYVNAIPYYEKVNKLDVPILLEFEALMKKVNALIELERLDDAIIELKEILADNRFIDYFAIVETKLGNISEYQEMPQFALEQYHDVIKKYNKGEGPALSAFYIAQLYEHEFVRFDSAKIYYDKVRSFSPSSEAAGDAAVKSKLLDEYLKLRDRLNKDISDYIKLTKGDSLLIDSVDIEVKEEINPEIESLSSDRFSERPFSDQPDSTEDEINSNITKKSEPAKKAVNRDPDLVYNSMMKNTFSLGEYFLLRYQLPDSAKTIYLHFVNNFQDSLLSPKAYYALYYIYSGNESTQSKADSIKSIIINTYPNSLYAAKFITPEKIKKSKTAMADSIANSLYLEAENLLEANRYVSAIKKFEAITEIDSASIWAAKSRYAIAYTYENYLNNIPKAIDNYTIIANKYPKSEFSIIAKNKIKEIPPEVLPSDSLQSTIENSDSTSDSLESGQENTLLPENNLDSGVILDSLNTKDSEKKILEKTRFER
ncbi:MAG: tetratricopeptide repeat protein [Calditrichaceae bacterium]|nr:tetratricopeptide repeat protein [Calditrichaceae bacterium]MBN2709888.1 tetratricopeptide repeat protein [Calditrichaceae bacterium]